MNIENYLNKAANDSNFDRVFYKQGNQPTNIDKIYFILFNGDWRGFVWQAIFLNKLIESNKDYYYIIGTNNEWTEVLPHFNGEIWHPKKELEKIWKEDTHLFGVCNYKDKKYYTSLNLYFNNLFDQYKIENDLWENGLKSEYFDKYNEISSLNIDKKSFSYLGLELCEKLNKLRGIPVLIYPQKTVYIYRNKNLMKLNIPKDVYEKLIFSLSEVGFSPVTYCDRNCYDIKDSISNLSLIKLITLMQHVGFVIDVFGTISKLAMISNVEYLNIIERETYNYFADEQLGLIYNKNSSSHNLFTFFPMLENFSEKNWKINIIDAIINKSKILINSINDKNNFNKNISFDKKTFFTKLINKYKPGFIGKFVPNKIKNIK